MRIPGLLWPLLASAMTTFTSCLAFSVTPVDFGFPVPSPEPTLVSGMEPFAPPEIPVGTMGPQISEMLRSAGPGEIVTLTGENFLQGTTQFQLFTQTSTQNWQMSQAESLVVQGQTASIKVPAHLKSWSMALVWPENRGVHGKAFALNRTEAWWLGKGPALVGQTLSIFGRNLAKSNGSTTSFVYLKPVGSPGSWVTPTTVNPYKVDFVVPSLSAGTYEVWIHNGHGGSYGWSGPLNLEVAASSPWAGQELTTFSVTTYGAVGDGVTDDGAAIEAALADAAVNAPSTIYFPAGTYAVQRTFAVPSNVRWLGAGRDSSILKLAVPLSTITGNGFLHGWPQNAVFEDITINADNQIDAWPGSMLFFSGENIKFKNARLSTWGAHYMEVPGLRLFFENVEMIGTGAFLGDSEDVYVENCVFKMTNDGEAGMTLWGGQRAAFINNTYNNANESISTGFGIGRLFVNQTHFGNSKHMYFAGNQSANYAPRDCNYVDCNKGEQILFEQVGGEWTGIPTSVTATTATFSSHEILEAGSGISVTIVHGRGLGQTRAITSLVGNTITVDRPWDVVPDTTTSRLRISPNADKIVIYNNILQGNSRYTVDETSSTGVLAWGSVYNLIVDSNHLSKFRFGVMINGTGGEEESIYAPNFNLVTKNTISNSFIGLYTGAMHKDLDDPAVVGGMGNVFRGNEITDITNIGIALETWHRRGGDFHATVFEKNSVVNTHHAVIAAEKIVWTIPPANFIPTRINGTHFKGTVLSENTFIRGSASASGSIGFRSEPYHTWLNDNSIWDGFETGNMLLSK